MPPPPADTPAATLTPPRRLVGCGQAGLGLDIAIADPETGQRLGDGRVGEIRVAGSSLARGYWQRLDQTAQVFGQPLTGASDTGRAWLKTGDLGAIMDGELYVTGRIKDLIIIRGRNHYPQDVEAAITNACPDLAAGPPRRFRSKPAAPRAWWRWSRSSGNACAASTARCSMAMPWKPWRRPWNSDWTGWWCCVPTPS
ncbi:AMP-binding protein [Tistrella bauzanensis]